ncbi:hypothetical protein N7533_011376 [Penicillium manginii]|uniref:uncharacterized protein n=1 Tax=Penicillium manginii TaxID=203109 RepID=UPI0025496235|nr:uncharacterized protein N7533_011376 [Penicillium manginii]KAJ5741967.1 hypothetical protein N7533_011376 [Penicillium manginii]
MGTPDSYLPPALSAETITSLILSLDLPAPSSIEPLQVKAAFHSIYLIHFASAQGITARANKDNTVTLVLRVSGRQLPGIKTRNEVGIMTWVGKHTSIPVPAIIQSDATENNVIGHAFTLLEKASGISVDQIYATLSNEVKKQMVHQLTDYLIELHAQPWHEGYQTPDLDKYWSASTEVKSTETLESLNPIPAEGFPSYSAYTNSCLERYIDVIEVHPSLEPYRDLISRIREFMAQLRRPDNQAELNRVAYIMAHKDMQFANIMCDPDQPGCPITAVLRLGVQRGGSRPEVEPPAGIPVEHKMGP